MGVTKGFKNKGNSPWAKIASRTPDKTCRNDIGVPSIHVNFGGAVLFLFIAQMYLRLELFVN
jgi:hypothetical protein